MSHKFDVREVLEGHITRVRRFWDGAYRGRGTEPVHQLRVSLRRLRNALSIFKAVFPSKDFKRWRKHSSFLLKDLGRARDRDIDVLLLSENRKGVRRPAEKKALSDLIRSFVRRRADAQPALVKAMDRFRANRILEEIEEALPLRRDVFGRRKLRDLADRTVHRRLNKLLQYEPSIMRPDRMKELHRMRIAVRKLRYTLETFEGVFGKDADPYLKAVKTLQGHLGKMHDYDACLQALTDTFASGKESRPKQGVVPHVGDSLQTMRSRSYDRFLNAWVRYGEAGLWEGLRRLTRGEGRGARGVRQEAERETKNYENCRFSGCSCQPARPGMRR